MIHNKSLGCVLLLAFGMFLAASGHAQQPQPSCCGLLRLSAGLARRWRAGGGGGLSLRSPGGACPTVLWQNTV